MKKGVRVGAFALALSFNILLLQSASAQLQSGHYRNPSTTALIHVGGFPGGYTWVRQTLIIAGDPAYDCYGAWNTAVDYLIPFAYKGVVSSFRGVANGTIVCSGVPITLHLINVRASFSQPNPQQIIVSSGWLGGTYSRVPFPFATVSGAPETKPPSIKLGKFRYFVATAQNQQPTVFRGTLKLRAAANQWLY
jgi:hypothetical protein